MTPSLSDADKIRQLEFRVQSLKQANQQLYRQQEQFRTTFAQAAVGIVHTGVGGEFLMVNPTFCKMVGYGANKLTKMTFVE
ncbi:MAG: PAS domain S-box protein, partial [Cyanophyceae cyanobacterium]